MVKLAVHFCCCQSTNCNTICIFKHPVRWYSISISHEHPVLSPYWCYSVALSLCSLLTNDTMLLYTSSNQKGNYFIQSFQLLLEQSLIYEGRNKICLYNSSVFKFFTFDAIYVLPTLVSLYSQHSMKEAVNPPKISFLLF